MLQYCWAQLYVVSSVNLLDAFLFPNIKKEWNKLYCMQNKIVDLMLIFPVYLISH